MQLEFKEDADVGIMILEIIVGVQFVFHFNSSIG